MVSLFSTKFRAGLTSCGILIGIGLIMSVTAQPVQAETVVIKPVSWWQKNYDDSWASQSAYYTPLSTSGDSWDIYNLSYGIDGATAMYQATGNTKYIDQALAFSNNVMNTARPSSSLSGSEFKDGYLSWPNLSHPQLGNDGNEYALFESYGFRYVTRMLRVIRSTPALYNNPVYKSQYSELLSFTEKNVFDKWRARGVESYIYRQNTHMASHWAFIAMDLQTISTSSTRRAQARQIFNDINYHLPNYKNASLRGQFIQNPADTQALFWNYDWNSSARPGSDVAHGNNVIAFIVDAHDKKRGSWSDDDIKRLTRTFNSVIWKSSTSYAANVDGSGTGTGWFSDGFVKLGRYDRSLQKRIEGITVGQGAQLYGNGALSAKLLTAN